MIPIESICSLIFEFKMKPDTRRIPGKKDWSFMIRSIFLSLAFMVVIGSFVLAAAVKTPALAERPPSALMIGDSLSVGSFGEVLQQHFESRYGRSWIDSLAQCIGGMHAN